MIVLKVIGEVVKWYFIADAAFLASVGIGEILRQQAETPEDGVIDNDSRVFDRMVSNYKKWWSYLKG